MKYPGTVIDEFSIDIQISFHEKCEKEMRIQKSK